MSGFQLNQDVAKKAGNSEWLTESGIFDFSIVECRYTFGQNGSQSKALEFDLVTRDGLKCNYLSVWYAKRDGSNNASGFNLINAIMYLTGLDSVSQVDQGDKQVAPEFAGKKIKLAVRKTLGTKQDGSDKFSFDILCAFDVKSGQTAAEKMDGKQANKLANFGDIHDKDERQAQTTGSTPPLESYQNNPMDGFDDDDDWEKHLG